MFEGSGEKIQNNAEKEKTEKKEGTSNEEKVGKIDEIFDELLDKVKDAPEAQREALKILIQQMRQIGDQMKQVRDVKHLQEMKTLMMKNWKELEELAGGDPQLLKTIQGWGKRFIEEKIIYYELIGDVKDELIDKSQEIQEKWDEMVADLGAITGLVAHNSYTIMSILDGGNICIGNFKSGIEKFMENITDPEAHYFIEGLPIKEINDFLSNVSAAIFTLAKDLEDYSTIDDPERMRKKEKAEMLLKKVIENKKLISRDIKDTSKIFRVIKKVRDTHFLNLYNEQPEQAAV